MVLTETSIQDIENALKEFPESKKALESLFPAYFEDKNSVRITENDKGHFLDEARNLLFLPRVYGEYKHKAIYLTSRYNWELVKSAGETLLVPTKKLYMYCFIQHDDTRQVDITTDFYEFQNRYNLNYGDRISVVNQLQEKIHESITVADYLKELPET